MADKKTKKRSPQSNILRTTREEAIDNAATLIMLALKGNLSSKLQEKMIRVAIWWVTESNGKYSLDYITEGARRQLNENRRSLNDKFKDLRHEHVWRIKDLIGYFKLKRWKKNLLKEKLSQYAVACVVTLGEHKELNRFDRKNPSINGWKRYKGVPKITVLHAKSHKRVDRFKNVPPLD